MLGRVCGFRGNRTHKVNIFQWLISSNTKRSIHSTVPAPLLTFKILLHTQYLPTTSLYIAMTLYRARSYNYHAVLNGSRAGLGWVLAYILISRHFSLRKKNINIKRYQGAGQRRRTEPEAVYKRGCRIERESSR